MVTQNSIFVIKLISTHSDSWNENCSLLSGTNCKGLFRTTNSTGVPNCGQIHPWQHTELKFFLEIAQHTFASLEDWNENCSLLDGTSCTGLSNTTNFPGTTINLDKLPITVASNTELIPIQIMCSKKAYLSLYNLVMRNIE